MRATHELPSDDADRGRTGERHSALVRLDELDDYEVADEEPDLRGWEVRDRDGRPIGRVHSLVVDTGALEVRYLDVELDGGVVGTEGHGHVLVPIGCATLADDADHVVVRTVAAADLAGVPRYDHRPITREFEEAVRACHAPATRDAEPGDAAGVARQPLFDSTAFWGARRAGRAHAGYLVRVRRP